MKTGTTRPRGEGEGRGAVLIPLGIVVLGVLELTLLILVGMWTSLWWILVAVAIGWIIAFALVVAAGQQSFIRLRSLIRAFRGRGDVKDHMSRPAFTLLAAACFFFPGFITDAIGLVLLFTPVQKRTARAVGLRGSDAGRRMLYSRSRGGVIDGEIVVTAEPAQRSDGTRRDGPGEGGSYASPRVITQD